MRLLERGRDAPPGERPAAGEPLTLAMPERDLGLPELPAQQDHLAVHLAREVDQAERDVLQQRAAALDLAHDRIELLDERARLGAVTDELRGRQRRRLDAADRGQAAPLLIQPQRAA